MTVNSRDKLRDCLKDEKYLTSVYDACAHVLRAPTLREMALNHIHDGHGNSGKIRDLMGSKGWDDDTGASLVSRAHQDA